MSLRTQAALYYIAAALFAIATALNFYNEGLNLKTFVGVIFAGAMLSLGIKSRRNAGADTQPPA